jgi:hypothetical protein
LEGRTIPHQQLMGKRFICIMLLTLMLLNSTVIMGLSCYMSTGNPACLNCLPYCTGFASKQACAYMCMRMRMHMHTHAPIELGSTKCYAFLQYLKSFWSTIKLNYYTTKYSDLNKGITRRFVSCDI